jgi:hypothetical protein
MTPLMAIVATMVLPPSTASEQTTHEGLGFDSRDTNPRQLRNLIRLLASGSLERFDEDLQKTAAVGRISHQKQSHPNPDGALSLARNWQSSPR